MAKVEQKQGLSSEQTGAALNLAAALGRFMATFPDAITASESLAQPAEVTPVEDDEVSEDAIRARAGDICALVPDGSGKTKCVECIKKIGGGKITDLKTPALRKKCLAALDKLYTELSESL